jgi:ABC-type oligopeptide transport system substrate-binding subunit
MYRTRFLAVFLIAVAVSLVSCSKSDTNQSAAIPANTEVVANSNSVDANKPSGGQVTVISGADKGVIKIRSTGFR